MADENRQGWSAREQEAVARHERECAEARLVPTEESRRRAAEGAVGDGDKPAEGGQP